MGNDNDQSQFVLRGKSLRTTHGLVLATSPRSINQTSPSCVLGIFGLQAVEHLEGFIGEMPTLFDHLGFVIQF